MNTKNLITVPVAGLALVGSLSWVNPTEEIVTYTNEVIREIKTKFDAFFDRVPEDRVYLHFDKPFYEPGETIWFAAYLRDGKTLKPSSQSDIVHVEFINPKGSAERHIKLIAHNGKAAGDFTLDPEIAGGLYKIKAYTQWQKNEGENNCFEKEIQVQDFVLPNLKMKLDFERKAFGAGDEVIAKLEVQTNENNPLPAHKIRIAANLKGEKFYEGDQITDAAGMRFIRFKLPEKLETADGLLNVMIDYMGQTESVSRSIPIILNKIKFQILPEGGDLVAGIESRVAFRAVNEFGKPADVEGIVISSTGKQVAKFSSIHQGMGDFSLSPQENEKYVVRITKPEGIKDAFELPEALPRGFTMHIDNSNNEELYIQISSTETENLSIAAQLRGKIYHSASIMAKPGLNHLSVPKNIFPAGVAQFTLFDGKGIPRAERLVFVNQNKQLQVSVETDKEKYLPREKVNLTLSVKDERGIPMPANFSLAVVNDQLLSFADDKSGNILTKLLLENDLKEKVEEPLFYFKKDEPKAVRALDLLLMTSGWRRYTWKEILEDEMPQMAYEGEKAIIAGFIRDAYTGKAVPDASIITGNNKFLFKTDSTGNFSIANIDLFQPLNLLISASGYNRQNYPVYDYNRNLTFYLYNNRYYNQWWDMPASQAMGGGEAGVLEEDRVIARNVRGGALKPAAARIPVNRMMAFDKSAKAEPVGDLQRIENEENKNDEVKKRKVSQSLRVNDRRGLMIQGKTVAEKEQQGNVVAYYCAKEFVSPVYDKVETPEMRTDFRSTIYWNPSVDIDRSGKKTIEFYNSDDITSFRVTAEGIAADGMVGQSQKTFFTQLPFSMTVKAPVEAVTDDIVAIPLTLKNNTDRPVSGLLKVKVPSELLALETTPELQVLGAGKAKTIFLKYRVNHTVANGSIEVVFTACGLSDAFSSPLKIVPRGFPVSVSFSGQEKEAEYEIHIRNLVKGSLIAKFTAFPSVVSDLISGVESILHEPSGCFEQTSATSYPNAMVMDYLKTTDNKDEKLLAHAGQLLDKGYKRLTSFETSQKGYEWFGQAPGHEGLTAYGVMQFNDLKKVYEGVDDNMLDRTTRWLLDNRDGKGGFKRNQRALHNFGMISDDILNGYIVYALTEAGTKGIDKEVDAAYDKAVSSKDPYQLAMNANALWRHNDKRYEKVMSMLYEKQKDDGSFDGLSHSIVYSTGNSLTIETTSLAILAMLKSPSHDRNAIKKAVQCLVKSRSGYGSFGNTQGTVLALKALTEYAKANKKTPEDGIIEVYIDGEKAGERSYKAGEKEQIVIENLEKELNEGKHKIRVRYSGTENPLPYTLVVTWNTSLPESDDKCKIALQTKLAKREALQGETVRMNITLKNKTSEGLPSPIAIVGIPAGMTVQPWQLKELQEKKVFDYYEVTGNNVVFYYRAFAPSDIKEINLDLKADIPGEYEAAASSAYLYYTNENKSWDGGEKVKILN
ncbi:MAG: hypothetical protein HYY40_12030 [Bacteroidetes bacterium]|nr:hypothetical protein [Bacteroidota bacterium]